MKHIGVKSAGIILGGSLLVSGCSREIPASMLNNQQSNAEQQAGAVNDAATPSPINPCDLQEQTVPTSPEQSTDCAHMMQAGKVALVGYGIDTEALQDIATTAEYLVTSASDGGLHLDIVPTMASAAQMQALKKVSKKACASAGSYETTPGYITDTVGIYDDYNLVIGATSLPSCPPSSVAGLYSSQLGGRYISAYGQKNQEKPGTIANTEQYAEVITHEIMHSFTLGHANTLVGASVVDELTRDGKKAKISLQSMLRNGVFDEYGEPLNVMGSGIGDMNDTTTFLNLAQLAWLQELAPTKHDQAVLFKEITSESTRITQQDVFTLTLPHDIRIRKFIDGQTASSVEADGTDITYNKVAFFSTVRKTGNSKIVPSISVQLLSRDHNELDLGELFPIDTAKEWLFDADGIVVSLQFDSAGVSIKRLTR